MAGPGHALGLTYVRGGANRLDRPNIVEALDASLAAAADRLRGPLSGALARPGHQLLRPPGLPARWTARTFTPIEETLEVLSDLVRAGKVRHVGVSNETPWGLRYLQLAERGTCRGW